MSQGDAGTKIPPLCPGCVLPIFRGCLEWGACSTTAPTLQPAGSPRLLQQAHIATCRSRQPVRAERCSGQELSDAPAKS